MWFGIKNVDYTLLRNNKIPHLLQSCTVNDSNETINIYCFPEEYLSKVNEVLGFNKNIKYNTKSTNVEGIFLLETVVDLEKEITMENAEYKNEKIEETKSEWTVNWIESLSHSSKINEIQKKEFTTYLQKVANITKKHIKVGVPHGAKKDYPTNTVNYIHVYIWSQISSNTFSFITTPDTMWGIQVGMKESAFLPSKKGYLIRCPESNYVVAEVIGSALYIHHDVCHYNIVNEDMLFKRILDEFITIYTMSPEQCKQFILKQEADESLAAKEQFKTLIQSDINKSIERIKNKIVTDFSNIDNYKKLMLESIRDVKQNEIIVEALSNKVDSLSEQLEKEYAKILQIERVKRIEIKDKNILVYTKMIYINAPSFADKKIMKIYKIGEFCIKIGIESVIKFENLTNNGQGPGYTRPVDFNANYDYNRHHPHIQHNGNACLGTLSPVIPKYLAEYQYSVLVILLIQFLQTVTLDDSAGRGIYWWPIVDKMEE